MPHSCAKACLTHAKAAAVKSTTETSRRDQAMAKTGSTPARTGSFFFLSPLAPHLTLPPSQLFHLIGSASASCPFHCRLPLFHCCPSHQYPCQRSQITRASARLGVHVHVDKCHQISSSTITSSMFSTLLLREWRVHQIFRVFGPSFWISRESQQRAKCARAKCA